jgi:3-hydroxy-9,10-secoandrosta-1,3,5(10)-triene-9,17-dione monooxygenase reductase component
LSEISGRLSGPRDDEAEGPSEPTELRADAQGARWMRRHMAGAVTVITAVAEGKYRGATLTSASLVSSEPLHVLVSIELESQMNGWLNQADSFALNVLPWQEQFLADQFAGYAPRALPGFPGIDHFFSETGSPILSKSIAWADCRIIQIFETGDHRCFIGEAVSIGGGSGDEDDPMVYYLNRYRRFK